MPTTANFSLEYPDDNSSVDIAGHFETLADDVDAAISTRLPLTGGTLTGNLTISKSEPVFTLSGNVETKRSIHFQTSGVDRWRIVAANNPESGSNVGSDFRLDSYTDAGGYMGSPLTIIRQTGWAYFGGNVNIAGATTLTGNLTISKASPTLMVSASSGESRLDISGTAASNRALRFRTAGVARWTMFGADGTAESGANAGSNFILASYDDAGSYISSPLTITRSTGAVTLTGDLTVNKGDAQFTLGSGSGAGIVLIKGAAGNARNVRFATGTSLRWAQGANTTTESGSNAGSDFTIARYSDAAAFIDTPLTITRSTGAVTLTGDLTISKATAVQTLSSSSGAVTSNIDRVAGQNGLLRFRTGTSSRWVLRTDNSAESSTAFGSDFSIDSYNNSGVYIESPVFISRSSGVVTVGNASTAGLSLGYSGPRMMSGTGSPEGVVTAPIGSIWFQSDSTVGVTHWKKASGAGNTGWVVMSGDTGWRDVSASLNATFLTANPNAKMRIRRTNDTVQVAYQAGTSATFTTNYATVYDPPTGFRTRSDTGFGVPYMALMDPTSATGTTKTLYVSGNSLLSGGTWVSATNYWGNMTYTTTETWPTSLPGSAA